MIPASDLARWAEDAKKATQGEWFARFEETVSVREADGSKVCAMHWLKGRHGLGGRRPDRVVEANARHIANASPANFLSLLAEVERLRAENEQLKNGRD